LKNPEELTFAKRQTNISKNGKIIDHPSLLKLEEIQLQSLFDYLDTNHL